MPAIPHYSIANESPVVGFEADGWTRFLTLNGERAFKIGGSCDTCAFFFERVKSNRLSPEDVAARLRQGNDLLDNDLLSTVAALLPSGEYGAVATSVSPTATRPCAPDDYFTHESIDLFGMPSYEGVPNNPRIPYWRAGSLTLPADAGARWTPGGPRPRPIQPKRFFHFLAPMEPPHTYDAERVDLYRQMLAGGARPVAVGVSVLDVRAPAVIPWDKGGDDGYEYGEHWCLATYVIDGHHKIEAAARDSRPVDLLSFLARDASIASDQDLDAVISTLSARQD
jgi:hypothetical protein